MSEEERNLETIAIVGRSQVKNLKRLKELCMLNILNNSAWFSQQLENPLLRISPALHRDFVKFLELYGSLQEQLEPEEQDNIFTLLDLLLNESTSEFDFIVFSRRNSQHNRDQEMWTVLNNKCPNLVRITDRREIDFSEEIVFQNPRLATVMPFIITLPKLLHIDLHFYICEEDDLFELAESFPNLLTLNVVFEHLSYNAMHNLFKFQKLEVFKTNLRYPLDVTMQEVMEFSQSAIMDECVKHLPALRVACTDNSSENLRYGFHNSRPGSARRTLPLEYLRVKKKFIGWSAAMLPNVTNLWLQGPLDNVAEFLGFQNVTTLKLCEVNPADTMKLLSECRGRLRELTIFTLNSNEWFTYDPHKIFFLCPKLHKMDWNAEVNTGRPDLYPVFAENFEYLGQFEFYSPLLRFPSSMVTHVLKAQNLDFFGIINLKLSVEDLADLTSCLKNKTILQNLRDFKLTYGEEEVSHELIKFLKLLPCYAPRLQKLSCFNGTREFLYELRNANIGNLAIPGFEFEMNNDFDDLLEG